MSAIPRTFLTRPRPALGAARARLTARTTGNAIDDEVRAIVDGALERTLGILRERRDVLERAARRLLEKETLDETDLVELVGAPAARPRTGVDVEMVPVETAAGNRTMI